MRVWLTPGPLSAGELEQASGLEAPVFGHRLSEQIGGQWAAGFLLCGLHEGAQPQPRFERVLR